MAIRHRSMHVLVHTRLGNMHAWRHGQDYMETMLSRRVNLVAPRNVILHRMGQLAPPTLDVVPHMHLHRCAHPKGPRALVNRMQERFLIHPKRGGHVPFKNASKLGKGCTPPSTKAGRSCGTTLPCP